MRIIEKKLNSVEYAQVERILEKIAAENNIENVNGISVEIDDRTATIKYAADLPSWQEVKDTAGNVASGIGDAVNTAYQGVQNYFNPAAPQTPTGPTAGPQVENPYAAGASPYGTPTVNPPATNANPGITAPETYGNDFNNPETPWGNSISEFLAAHGKPSDFNSRRQMAVDFGIVNSPNEYTGTAQQNTQLLGLMSSGQGGHPLHQHLVEFLQILG